MATPSPFLRALFAFTVSSMFINNGPVKAAGLASFTESAPSGFEDLTSEREVVLDAYFGGQKLGDVRAVISPGFVTFKDPQAVARIIPDVSQLAKLVSALTGPMPANVSLACGPSRDERCGVLRPGNAGVILDQENFRVDIFVHSELLIQPNPSAAYYLAPPVNRPSLVSLLGATLSGSSRGGTSWHLQNRSVASLGNFRLRSDSSVTKDAGFEIDNLSVEADRRDWRFVGGIFWAPGTELIGRRRMVGLGVATQLDTRLNKTALLGTPLEVFLQTTARVELLINGRIASSRIYPSGNRLIDTSTLPNGTYEIILRIQEDGRPAREEQRFFTKGPSMAPAGRPLFSGFVGLLPSSTRGFAVDGKTLFYEGTAAYRLNPSVGLDGAILGTPRKAILETGAVYHSRIAQIRLSGLVSTAGDHGVALRATTVGNGPVSFTFDLRKISSRDGRPLLPISSARGTFSEDAKLGFADRGSYTQALSILSYRIRQATLRVTGLYLKNGDNEANHSIGASIETPLVRSNRWDLILLADARKTHRDFTSYIGFRFLANRGDVAVSGSAGMVRETGRDTRPSQLVGEAQATWQRTLNEQSQLSTDVAIGLNPDGTYTRASAHMRAPSFNSRADVLHQFGENGTTQFAATIDTGIVVTKSGIGIAGRNINDTGILVRIAGGGADQKFDVLINDVVRGTAVAGKRFVLFLQPYETYDVRLRSRQISGFNPAPRTVTLYPGNVAELEWQVTPLFILFGRAVADDGTALDHVDIRGSHGISRTDSEGYFQIETNGQDQLRVSRKFKSTCTITVSAASPVAGFVSGGDQVCRP